MSLPLPSQRYRLLVEQLLADERERRGQDWGTIAAVARRLKVKPQFLSMVIAGKRSGDSVAITRAVHGLPIRADFFYDVSEAEPHYTDYLVKVEGKTRAADPQYWAEFLTHYEFLDELTAADLELMRGFAAGRRLRIRGWSDWVQLAEWVRQRRPSRIFEEKTKAAKKNE
jgi:hypothetical protein